MTQILHQILRAPPRANVVPGCRIGQLAAEPGGCSAAISQPFSLTWSREGRARD
jgi:hypothetical protein